MKIFGTSFGTPEKEDKKLEAFYIGSFAKHTWYFQSTESVFFAKLETSRFIKRTHPPPRNSGRTKLLVCKSRQQNPKKLIKNSWLNSLGTQNYSSWAIKAKELNDVQADDQKNRMNRCGSFDFFRLTLIIYFFSQNSRSFLFQAQFFLNWACKEFG